MEVPILVFAVGDGARVLAVSCGWNGQSELTEAVIGAACEAANVLGAGFLEVHEQALIRELTCGVNAKSRVC